MTTPTGLGTPSDPEAKALERFLAHHHFEVTQAIAKETSEALYPTSASEPSTVTITYPADLISVSADGMLFLSIFIPGICTCDNPLSHVSPDYLARIQDLFTGNHLLVVSFLALISAYCNVHEADQMLNAETSAHVVDFLKTWLDELSKDNVKGLLTSN